MGKKKAGKACELKDYSDLHMEALWKELGQHGSNGPITMRA